MNLKARFITFEGIDGAGKTTQIKAVQETLAGRGIRICMTREPGGTPLGEKIRTLLLHEDMFPDTESLLFFASRIEHVRQVIRPALERGAWVLCDRFTDATFAYQVGGKGVPAVKIEELEKWSLGSFAPDLTVLFDLDPVIAAGRLKKARLADRFESEDVRFFTRVRDAYLERAARSPERFLVVDSNRPSEVISKELKEYFETWL